MGKLSSTKGATYERRVASTVSLWLTEGLSDDAIWRSAMSGGRTTLKSRMIKKAAIHSTQAGDFDGNSPEGHEFVRAFYCDSKHVKDLKTWAWVYQNQGICSETVDTVWIEAAMYDRIPLGLFRENNRDDLMLTNPRGHNVFKEAYRALRRDPKAHVPHLNRFFRDIDYPTGEKDPKTGKPKKVRKTEPIYVYRWSCFSTQISWAMVRRVLIARKLLTPNRDVMMRRPITGPPA